MTFGITIGKWVGQSALVCLLSFVPVWLSHHMSTVHHNPNHGHYHNHGDHSHHKQTPDPGLKTQHPKQDPAPHQVGEHELTTGHNRKTNTENPLPPGLVTYRDGLFTSHNQPRWLQRVPCGYYFKGIPLFRARAPPFLLSA